MLVPIWIGVWGGSTPAPRADDPSYCGLSTGMISPTTADVDGTDTERSTITMTLGDAADASPFVRLTSGTSISIREDRVASDCTTPLPRLLHHGRNHSHDCGSVCAVVTADTTVVAVHPAAAMDMPSAK